MKVIFLDFVFLNFLTLNISCQGSRYEMRSELKEQEYRSFLVESKGTITGRVFLKTKGCGTMVGIRGDVYLNPATSYSREWYENVIKQDWHYYRDGDGEESSRSPSLIADRFLKMVKADENGEFKFNDVAPGEYFITSTIHWIRDWYWYEIIFTIFIPPSSEMSTGGIAHANVIIGMNQSVEVDVTNNREYAQPVEPEIFERQRYLPPKYNE